MSFIAGESVGGVYSMEYDQFNTGNHERVVKVLGVRDTRVHPVSQKTKMTNHINRSRYLITAQQTDGQVRSFYTDEIGLNTKRIGLLGRVALYFSGVRFYK